MSITASFVIPVVLLVRLFLKRAPKIFSYALWAVVLFRLICPFSFESSVGMLPVSTTPIPQDIVYSSEPQIKTGLNIVDNAVNTVLPVPDHAEDSMNPLQLWAFIGSVTWIIGITAMLLYSIIYFVMLKRKLIGAAPLRDNIYLADHISSPFVMGFIKPKIYLPSDLSDTEYGFIIAHEKHHIKRLDHIARILGFIALAIHWFNPLVWLAFVLSGKDMEMSCDEAVMKEIDTDIRAEYSRSLLRFAAGRKLITATPLAFGEGDTKERVKNVMKYKKPVLWVSVIAIIAVVCVGVGLLGNHKTEAALKGTAKSIIFPAYEMANPDNLPIIDMVNSTEKFALAGVFPESWEFRSENNGETLPPGVFYTLVYIYESDKLIGYIAFSPFEFEVPEGVTKDSAYPYIHPNLRMSSQFQWEPYTAVKSLENGQVGVVDITYMDPNDIPNHPGAMPDVDQLETSGIVAYDMELKVSAAIAFMPGSIEREAAVSIAESIEISNVE
ncbi:MAG: M56 family metallopeptidase [Clostridiales bacterium]|nr:M56 family metallopeptidase [Clostridiales bacterium]